MQSPENYNGRPTLANIILQASAAKTATGTGSEITLDGYEAIVFQCELTAAATDAGDTLDVFVQTTIDGTTWLDAVHFTQMLGNGDAKAGAVELVEKLRTEVRVL